MSYAYFASYYSHPHGFGACSLVLAAPVSTWSDVQKVRELIELRNGFRSGDVVVIHYQPLDSAA